jgi:hypothetical protein
MAMVEMIPFSAWLSANPRFNALDYLFYAFSENPLPIDLAEALVKFLVPRFVVREEKALVAEVGAAERYTALRKQGKDCNQAQYWANLTEISGLFGAEVASERELGLANSICRLWQVALADAGLNHGQQARVIVDHAEGEIYLTISSVESSYHP